MPATRQSRTLAGRVTRTRGYPAALDDPMPKSLTPRRSKAALKPKTSVTTISGQKPSVTSAINNYAANKETDDTKKSTKAGGSYKEKTTPDAARRSGRQRTLSKRLQDMELGFGNRKSSPRKAGLDGVKKDDQKEETLTQVVKRKKLECDIVSEPATVFEGPKSGPSPPTLQEIADNTNTKSDGVPTNQSHEMEPETGMQSSVEFTLVTCDREAIVLKPSEAVIETPSEQQPDVTKDAEGAEDAEEDVCMRDVSDSVSGVAMAGSQQPSVSSGGIACSALLPNVESSTSGGQQEVPCAALVYGEKNVEKTESSTDTSNKYSSDVHDQPVKDKASEMTKEPSTCMEDDLSLQSFTKPAEGANVDDINIKQVEKPDSSDSVDHMETDADNLHKLDGGGAHHPDVGDGQVLKERENGQHTPEDDSGRQFVILEDGKPMLLTDADTIKTAADAVATLMQDGSEYSFNIRPQDIQNISMSLVRGRKRQTSSSLGTKQVELEIPMPPEVQSNEKTVARDDVKIKFVTVNLPPPPLTPALQKTQQTTNPVPVQLAQNLSATMLNGFYSCTMCKYKTDKKANWYKHKRKHSTPADKRPYECDQCGHRASTSSNLKRHQLTHTSIKTYKCDQCEMHFRQKIHLERHTRYKHMKKVIKCQYCDYVCANYNPDLKVHMKRKHFLNDTANRFKFRCATCGFLAACNRDLKQHEKFHRRGPELKLYCESCSFVTDCESRLKRHLLVHSKEKPFACGLCEYRASQKEHVLRHMKKKHDIHLEHQTQRKSAEPCVAVGDSDRGRGHLHQQGPPGESGEDQGPSAAKLKGTQDTGSPTGDSQNRGDDTTDTDRVNSNIPDGESEELVILKEQQGQVEANCDQRAHVRIDDGQAADSTGTEQPVDSTDNSQQGSVGQQGSDQAASTSVGECTNPSTDACVSQMEPQFVIQPARKKYIPSDYSGREKVFSCVHCTMKFAKLINLYKHLQVQHKDMQTSGPDDIHSCVWCDYQTNKKKNLLIHMRKHNYKEGEFMPSQQVYSCVVCNYCSNRRKALYAHMKKKHKVQIYLKADGTASCTIDDTLPSMFVPDSSSNGANTGKLAIGQQQGSVVVDSKHIVNQQLTKTNASGLGTQLVMLELEPGMPPTAVEIAVPPRDEMDHEAADAIEGLQALAHQVVATGEQSGQPGEQEPEPPEASQPGAEVEGEAHLDDGQEECKVAVRDVPSNIQLSEEQVLQLSSGDFIELNGEIYKVEFTSEESC